MCKENLITEYLEALNHSDIKTIMKLFEDDAIVYSPLYNEMSAQSFYQDLFQDTTESQTKLIDIFYGTKNLIACYFQYDWTLKDGTLYTFYCVDVFEISCNNKFQKLRIIYDTAGIRSTFESLNQSDKI